VRGDLEALRTLSRASDLASFARRDRGEPIVDHRTSFVRRHRLGALDVFAKTYEYATWRSRWHGILRYTSPFRPSRAAREFDAAAWLRAHGLASAEPLLAFEHRRLGLLARATLVTAAFPGKPVDAILARLAPVERPPLAEAVAAFVARAHALGFRDRNLDLRNLLAHRTPAGAWQVAKIDSPRYRLRRPGAADDALARADWARLLPQLAAFGLGDVAPQFGRLR
jgi:hypothetical protein